MYLRKLVLALTFSALMFSVFAQDTEVEKVDKRPVRSPFASTMLIEHQTIVVPSAKTLQFDIQHRFGKFNSETFDLIGLYAPSNIRLGLSYTPFKNIVVGIGSTKNMKVQDVNWKWSFLSQTRSNSTPIALTYSGNIGIEALPSETYAKGAHRISYYHELIIARKFTKDLTLQIAPSFSHFNAVDSIFDNDNISISFSGRYRVSPQSSIILNYDYPIVSGNDSPVEPNLAVGIEISTSSHAFQIFISSYDGIMPQYNSVFNTNDFFSGDILLGFNITRLWNF